MKKSKDPDHVTVPLEDFYNVIQQHPQGISYADLANTLGVKKGSLTSRLASLHNQGMLITEDDYGNVYPFS